MITAMETKLPRLVTALPGPKAKQVVEQDTKYMTPSYTRDYPLVAKRGQGALIEDVDGNVFMDFAAGIAVCSTGHCHPKVVEAIQKQAGELTSKIVNVQSAKVEMDLDVLIADRAEEAIMLYFLQVSAGTADHVQELGQAAWAVQDADRDPD